MMMSPAFMETFNAPPPSTKSGRRVFHTTTFDNFMDISHTNAELDPVTNIAGVGHGGGSFKCDVDQFVPMGTWSPTSDPIQTMHVVAWYDTRSVRRFLRRYFVALLCWRNRWRAL